MLYAGATEAVAMTVVEISPRAPDLRPLSSCCFLRLYGLLGGGHVSPSWLRPGAAGTVDPRQAVRRTGRI